ncbi:MAG: HD-GYP domain-containing protein [bacterium]
MRAALSDHEDFYGQLRESVASEGQSGCCGDSVIIGDADISGLSVVDFGSILGISLLSCAAGTCGRSDLGEVIDLMKAGISSHAVISENSYFGRHSKHVAEYSLAIARRLRLPIAKRKAIYVAGFLHDIGKLQVAPLILYKKGPLTPEEYENMKMHPILAMGMLSKVTFPWPVKPLILYHHERCDGSGYPEGLVEEGIPLGARVISVADFADAYTSGRLYRGAHSLDELIDLIMVYSGTIFDELVSVALMELVEEGTLWVCHDSELAEETVSESSQVLPVLDGEGILDQ